jgi:alkylation response protein AidB-like acyl-CoA dehydrogenase
MTITETSGRPGATVAAFPPTPVRALSDAVAVAAAHSEAADRDRRLHPETVVALAGAGFAGHFVPARWGGAAGTFAELLSATASVGESCASAAWCAGLWAAHSRFAAFLPEQGQREMWGASPHVLIAASVVPVTGTAVPAPDGWIVQGEWERVSGADHARWLLLAAMDSSADVPVARIFAVPRYDVTVLDTWNSSGLRGSGSNTVVLDPLFVPGHFSVPLTDVLLGRTGPGRARCHSVPAQLGGAIVFAAPILGMARHALRVWKQWATRPNAAGLAPAQTSASVREALARSSVEIDAARLLLEQTALQADTAVVTGEAIARSRRDTAFAVDLLVTAVERLSRSGGHHGATVEPELLRCWRDVHTASSHLALRLELAAEAYAEALFAP